MKTLQGITNINNTIKTARICEKISKTRFIGKLTFLSSKFKIMLQFWNINVCCLVNVTQDLRQFMYFSTI